MTCRVMDESGLMEDDSVLHIGAVPIVKREKTVALVCICVQWVVKTGTVSADGLSQFLSIRKRAWK